MIRLQWNGLRVGHFVLVHDESDPDMPLVPGKVVMLQTEPGSNDLGIRLSPAKGKSKVVRPRRLAVHLDPLDPDERCWRCATDANTATRLHRMAAATRSND